MPDRDTSQGSGAEPDDLRDQAECLLDDAVLALTGNPYRAAKLARQAAGVIEELIHAESPNRWPDPQEATDA